MVLLIYICVYFKQLGDGGNASKNLNFVDEMHEEKSQAAEKPMIDEIVELKQTEHVDMKKVCMLKVDLLLLKYVH